MCTVAVMCHSCYLVWCTVLPPAEHTADGGRPHVATGLSPVSNAAPHIPTAKTNMRRAPQAERDRRDITTATT
ncbi:unnamed protein product [Boreogadus saida]